MIYVFLRNITDCQDCTAGWYCNKNGLEVPAGQCKQGYYCSGRSTTETQHNCTQGHYCETGSPAPKPCPSGYYQNEIGQYQCKECQKGYYCNDTHGPVINYANYPCPEGHYCPVKTRYATQYRCPPGTFNNDTKREKLGDCLACTGGFACDQWGLVKPYKLCSAGYFCREGATTTTPNLGAKADQCPPGYYCPQGK